MHNTAVGRLGEIWKEPASSSGNNLNSSSSAPCSGIPKQATILTHIQKLSTRHRSQLTKKFQSAHFIVSEGHAFNFYSKLAHFEKTYHEVDLGDSYVSDTACAEMVKYISKSMKVKNITEPLNNGETNYYSVMIDDSSSAKTMDEKTFFNKNCSLWYSQIFNYEFRRGRGCWRGGSESSPWKVTWKISFD